MVQVMGRQASLLLVGAAVLLLEAACFFATANGPTPVPEPITPTPEMVATHTPLPPPTPTTLAKAPTATTTPTPVNVTLPITFESRPLAVMIDNSPSARPHTGLGTADLVYEAVVEAGVTRLMAVFGSGDSSVLGPVRSTRHYFAYWAHEHNAVLLHAGSSPQGFEAMYSLGLDRLDYSLGNGVYWRVSRPYAQSWENLYTDTTRDRALAPEGDGQLGSLHFRAGGTDKAGGISRISIPYPNGYVVEYHYDEGAGHYLRFISGRPHADEKSGEQFRATNIIIQWMDIWPIAGDDKGRMDMAFMGEGPARYFLDGSMIDGRWRKRGTRPTEFLQSNGEPMVFNRGQTWIMVVPTGEEITAE